MNLNDIHRGIKKFKSSRRIGRGPGSGHGKTSGRGHNGQKSRSGSSRQVVFQGGTMPMIRRIPKRGFNNKFALKVVNVNVDDLENTFDVGTEITPELLSSKGLIPVNFDVLKILGNGELKKKFTISAHRFSASAQEKIEKAGGQLNVLPGKKPVVKNKMGTAAAAKKAGS